MAILIIGVTGFMLMGPSLAETTSPDAGQTVEPLAYPVADVQKPLQEHRLTDVGKMSALWQAESGIWGPEEEGSGITGFSQQENAVLKLHFTDRVERFDAVIGAAVDEGKSVGFEKLTIEFFFADGSNLKAEILDFAQSLSVQLHAPKTSNASDGSPKLDLPRSWPLSLALKEDGWHFKLGKNTLPMRKFEQKLEGFYVAVKEGNVFIRDAFINQGLVE